MSVKERFNVTAREAEAAHLSALAALADIDNIHDKSKALLQIVTAARPALLARDMPALPFLSDACWMMKTWPEEARMPALDALVHLGDACYRNGKLSLERICILMDAIRHVADEIDPLPWNTQNILRGWTPRPPHAPLPKAPKL